MIDIGKILGADVPPCLAKQTVFAEGIGEILVPVEVKEKLYLLIIKPEFSCSTKKMFEKIDSNSDQYVDKSDITKKAIEALKTDNIQLLSETVFNKFEEALEENEKQIVDSTKKELLNNGAVAALMTGSGSCVCGIYRTRKDLKKAYNVLKDRYEAYVSMTY